MQPLLSAAAAFLFVTSSVPVDVGRFNSKDFPNLTTLERRMPHGDMVARVEQILAKRTCRLKGQTKTDFDITVPYAALMEDGGTLKRVVVKEIGCAPIETLIGQIVAARAARGDFPVKQGEGERWYASEVSFTKTDPSKLASSDPNKMICRKSEPVLGSRLQMTRMCKTVADWKIFDADREQMRRDMSNAAACGSSTSCSSD